MSRYSGKQDNSGPKTVRDSKGEIVSRRPNKGVVKRTRETKRIEAEERNARTTPGRRSWKHGGGNPAAHVQPYVDLVAEEA